MRINSLCINIQLARKGMTQTELAKKAGTTRQAISTLIRRETCEPRTLGKIAAALEVDIEQLIAKEA